MEIPIHWILLSIKEFVGLPELDANSELQEKYMEVCGSLYFHIIRNKKKGIESFLFSVFSRTSNDIFKRMDTIDNGEFDLNPKMRSQLCEFEKEDKKKISKEFFLFQMSGTRYIKWFEFFLISSNELEESIVSLKKKILRAKERPAETSNPSGTSVVKMEKACETALSSYENDIVFYCNKLIDLQ